VVGSIFDHSFAMSLKCLDAKPDRFLIMQERCQLSQPSDCRVIGTGLPIVWINRFNILCLLLTRQLLRKLNFFPVGLVAIFRRKLFLHGVADMDPDLDADPAIFVSNLQDVHLHNFSKIKSHKEVTKQ
jgi:hypothetical protein